MIDAPPRPARAATAEGHRRQQQDAVRARRAVAKRPPSVRGGPARRARVDRARVHREVATLVQVPLAQAVPTRGRGVTHELTPASNVRVR